MALHEKVRERLYDLKLLSYRQISIPASSEDPVLVFDPSDENEKDAIIYTFAADCFATIATNQTTAKIDIDDTKKRKKYLAGEQGIWFKRTTADKIFAKSKAAVPTTIEIEDYGEDNL